MVLVLPGFVTLLSRKFIGADVARLRVVDSVNKVECMKFCDIGYDKFDSKMPL